MFPVSTLTMQYSCENEKDLKVENLERKAEHMLPHLFKLLPPTHPDTHKHYARSVIKASIPVNPAPGCQNQL